MRRVKPSRVLLISAALGALLVAAFLLPLVALAMLSASNYRPVFLQEAMIVWPQRLVFTLYTHQDKPVLTGPLAYLMPLGFWTFAALVFGFLARRVRSMSVLFPLAVTFVVAVALLVGRLAPRFGWHIRIETP